MDIFLKTYTMDIYSLNDLQMYQRLRLSTNYAITLCQRNHGVLYMQDNLSMHRGTTYLSRKEIICQSDNVSKI